MYRGIKRAIFTEKGTMFSGNPSGVVPVGSSKPEKLVMVPFKVQKDKRNNSLRNMMKLTYSGSSYQFRVRDLKWFFEFSKAGFDAQFVGIEQDGSPASGGIYNFENQKYGLDWEYVLADDERYCDITFETAMEYEEYVNWLDQTDTAATLEPDISLDPISGGNNLGVNYSNYAHPWYLSIEAPDTVELFDKKDILKRKFSIKSLGRKNGYSETKVDKFAISLELTSWENSITKMVELLGKDMSPSLTIKEKITDSTSEVFTFDENILTHREEFEQGDDDGTAKIIFESELYYNQISFDETNQTMTVIK